MRYSLNTKVIFNEGTDEEIISYWGPSPRAWAIRWLYENIRRANDLTLTDLTDVGAGTPLDGQVLVYDGTDGEWGFGDGGSSAQSDWEETAPGDPAFILNKPTLFSGDYSDLTNAPTIFSGDYNDLTNAPTIFGGSYTDLTDLPDLFDGDYNNLTNAPTLFDGDYNSLTNTPVIPTAINDLTDVDTATASPTDGDSLVWNATGSNWEPGSPTFTLDDLGDISITNPQGGDILVYNIELGDYINTTIQSVAQSINDMTDVDTATAAPTDGQVLTWNQTNTEWEPSTVTASVTSIDDIGDVSSSSEQDGDVLTWNPTTNNWENGPLALNDLSNVNATPTDGQVLSWNFSNMSWEAATVAAGSVNNLDDVGDVNVSGASDDDVLSYDTTTNTWVTVNPDTFGAQVINDLNDVDTATTAPQNGQVLTWNGTNNEWEPQSAGGTGEVNVQSNWTETNTGADSFILNKPTLFDGNYNSLTNLPTLFDGNYNSLTNLPTLFDGAYSSLTGAPTLFDGDYNSLTNTPTLFDGAYTSLTGLPTLFDGNYNSLTNTPTIPANINDLGDVDTASAAPTDGQSLIWVAADSEWQPGTVTTTVNSLDDVGDVNITAPIDDGDVLVWDGTNEEWVNVENPAPQAIDDLTDVDTTTFAPNNGEVLTWVDVANNWVPYAPQNFYATNETLDENRFVNWVNDNDLTFRAYDGASSNAFTEAGIFQLASHGITLQLWQTADNGSSFDSHVTFGMEDNFCYFEQLNGTTSPGIIYTSDLSSNYSRRSLVDREFADSKNGVLVHLGGGTVANRFVSITSGNSGGFITTGTAATNATLSNLLGFITDDGSFTSNITTAYRSATVRIPNGSVAGSPAIGDAVYLSSTVAGQMTGSNASGVQVGLVTGNSSGEYYVLLQL